MRGFQHGDLFLVFQFVLDFLVFSKLLDGHVIGLSAADVERSSACWSVRVKSMQSSVWTEKKTCS
jgi:hypothetical protein